MAAAIRKATRAALPDFVKLADSFHAVGLRAERVEQLDDVIREMLATDRAVIADIAVDPKENCFPMIPSGAAHNEMILGPEHEDDGRRHHRRRPGAGLNAFPAHVAAWTWPAARMAARRWPAHSERDRVRSHPMPDTTQRSATISVLVDNEAGRPGARHRPVLRPRLQHRQPDRRAGGRASGGRSRINIVTSGTEMVIEQIKAQLDRLVPVHRVADLTLEGPHIAREMALIKVVGTGETARRGAAHRRRVPRPGGGRHARRASCSN